MNHSFKEKDLTKANTVKQKKKKKNYERYENIQNMVISILNFFKSQSFLI